MADKPRLGIKIRAVRREHDLTQAALAKMLDISASYLNLIEHDRRPLSATLMVRLAKVLDLDPHRLTEEGDLLLQTDLAEALDDPAFGADGFTRCEAMEIAAAHPAVARAVLGLYEQFQIARGTHEPTDGFKLAGVDRTRLPTNAVADFIQQHNNHFPELEHAVEVLWTEARLQPDRLCPGLNEHLLRKLNVRLFVDPASDGQALSRYDPDSQTLTLSDRLPRHIRRFQMAHRIALIEHSALLDRLTQHDALGTDAARRLARVRLASYFAHAALMPYRPMREAAVECRYDIERLCNRFDASFEQVCQRLAALRRENEPGVPFHFLRADLAGNITRWFDGSGMPVSPVCGSCPRSVLHRAVLTPGRICVQAARTPQGHVFLCVARTVTRGAAGHDHEQAVELVSIGCAAEHAHRVVYGDGLDWKDPSAAEPVGTTCRLCDLQSCSQRAYPAINRTGEIDEHKQPPCPCESSTA